MREEEDHVDPTPMPLLAVEEVDGEAAILSELRNGNENVNPSTTVPAGVPDSEEMSGSFSGDPMALAADHAGLQNGDVIANDHVIPSTAVPVDIPGGEEMTGSFSGDPRVMSAHHVGLQNGDVTANEHVIPSMTIPVGVPGGQEMSGSLSGDAMAIATDTGRDEVHARHVELQDKSQPNERSGSEKMTTQEFKKPIQGHRKAEHGGRSRSSSSPDSIDEGESLSSQALIAAVKRPESEMELTETKDGPSMQLQKEIHSDDMLEKNGEAEKRSCSGECHAEVLCYARCYWKSGKRVVIGLLQKVKALFTRAFFGIPKAEEEGVQLRHRLSPSAGNHANAPINVNGTKATRSGLGPELGEEALIFAEGRSAAAAGASTSTELPLAAFVAPARDYTIHAELQKNLDEVYEAEGAKLRGAWVTKPKQVAPSLLQQNPTFAEEEQQRAEGSSARLGPRRVDDEKEVSGLQLHRQKRSAMGINDVGGRPSQEAQHEHKQLQRQVQLDEQRAHGRTHQQGRVPYLGASSVGKYGKGPV